MFDNGISGTVQLRMGVFPIRKNEGNGSVKNRLSTMEGENHEMNIQIPLCTLHCVHGYYYIVISDTL